MDTKGKAARGSSLPRIKVTAEDSERLAGLASAAMDRMPVLAGYLSDELDRAQVVRAKVVRAGRSTLWSCGWAARSSSATTRTARFRS